MAVFTEVSTNEARELLRRLQLGDLVALRGIEGGIENTNYFLTSDQGEFVLTLFERLTAAQLPFYLYLMKHLAHHGMPVPDPRPDQNGDILHSVCGKPAAVVNKLRGKSQLAPQPVHCAAVGTMLARMHLAGRDYERSQPNLRGLPWWNETVPVVLPYLQEAQSALLRAELAYQNHVAASPACAAHWRRKPLRSTALRASRCSRMFMSMRSVTWRAVLFPPNITTTIYQSPHCTCTSTMTTVWKSPC